MNAKERIAAYAGQSAPSRRPPTSSRRSSISPRRPPTRPSASPRRWPPGSARRRAARWRWLAEPAGPPRVQHEAIVKLLAADFSDDATILASLGGLRQGIADARARLSPMTERVEQLPHRTRYLRLINDYARRSLDAQSDWLDHVERELGT
jgi:hypothetical protein